MKGEEGRIMSRNEGKRADGVHRLGDWVVGTPAYMSHEQARGTKKTNTPL
jgi:hypothetical protein